MTVLVLAAHPDDEVLGCGGTIAALAQAGHRVVVAILAEGITSRPDHDPAEVLRLRETARNVGELLGAEHVELHGLPDNRLDMVPMLTLAQMVEDIVDRVQPDVVYTQHGGDLNVDHAALFRATLTATRPVQGCPVRAVYAYEVASSTEWAFGQFGGFHPNAFVDITATLDAKLAAMALYETEGRAFPHPRSPEALTAQARRWGAAVGVGAAEAFAVVRELRRAA